MKNIRGHIICLDPNNKQTTHLKKACGVARFSLHVNLKQCFKSRSWALSEWKSQYQQDKAYRDKCLAKGIEIDKAKLNKPSQGKLRKQLNSIKQFPFMHATRGRI